MKAEEFREQRIEVEGWPVNLVSYRIGDAWHAKTDNVLPGALLGRGAAPAREEAERQAIAVAREKLSRTRRMAV